MVTTDKILRELESTTTEIEKLFQYIEKHVRPQCDYSTYCEITTRLLTALTSIRSDIAHLQELQAPIANECESETPHTQISKSTLDYLLTCVAEESAEVAKEATKGIRFGLNDTWKSKPTAHDALIAEFYDLATIMDILYESGALNRPSDTEIQDMKFRKRSRIRKYMRYSIENGSYSGDVI